MLWCAGLQSSNEKTKMRRSLSLQRWLWSEHGLCIPERGSRQSGAGQILLWSTRHLDLPLSKTEHFRCLLLSFCKAPWHESINKMIVQHKTLYIQWCMWFTSPRILVKKSYIVHRTLHYTCCWLLTIEKCTSLNFRTNTNLTCFSCSSSFKPVAS